MLDSIFVIEPERTFLVAEGTMYGSSVDGYKN